MGEQPDPFGENDRIISPNYWGGGVSVVTYKLNKTLFTWWLYYVDLICGLEAFLTFLMLIRQDVND